MAMTQKTEEDELLEIIEKTEKSLPASGDMSSTLEAQEACNAALGNDYLENFSNLKLYSIYKDSESTINSATSDAKEANKKIKEHNEKSDDKINEIDESEETTRAKRKAAKASKKLADDSSSAASKKFESSKGILSSQVTSFIAEANNLFTQAPIQVGVVSANPMTSNMVVTVALQILATIATLLNSASTIIAFAILINIPLPETMNKAIIQLAGLKKMLGKLVPFSINIPGGKIQDQIDKACDEATEVKDITERTEIEGYSASTESDTADALEINGYNYGYIVFPGDDVIIVPEDIEDIDKDMEWGPDDERPIDLTIEKIFAYKSPWFMNNDRTLVSSFTYSQTAKANNISNTPTLRIEYELRRLIIFVLDPLRKLFNSSPDFSGTTFTISSGYRSLELNKKIPNASSKSQHCSGQAVDIQIKKNGVNNKEYNKKLFYLLKDSGILFDQLINEYNFSWVHVSFVYGNCRMQSLSIYSK